jgi:methyl-accepting chemotaxis protein
MLFSLKKREMPQLPYAVTDAHDTHIDLSEFDSSRLYEVQATLKLQQERLQMLSGSTENEFLAIGARLQDFYMRSSEISKASAAVTDQMSGEEIQQNIRELGSIIDRMGDFLSLIEGEADQSSMTLRKTLQMIAEVDKPLAGFKKIMKVLNVLGISTKIESARLGDLGTGFHNLAEDVKNLAVQIDEKSSRIMGENVSLSCKIRETLARVSDIEAHQRKDVRLILDKTRSSLEMINGVHRKCSEVASAIASASGDVSRNISEIVTSMQFHDIVRQQLEHVQEALRDLEQWLSSDHARNNGMSRTAASGIEMAGEVFGVCRLQSAQLIHARDELHGAVTGIVQNLNSLACKGLGVAQQTREMIGAADGAGDSIFIEIEKGLAPVVGLLGKSAAANRNMTQAVWSVAETVNEISTFVVDIEAIGENIKLIAMNAQVKAAHTGVEGAALGVLAEAIQRLSVDACLQTAAVTDTLREITRVTEALSGDAALETCAGELDVEVMTGRLKGLIDSVRTMNESVMAVLAQSDSAVWELSNDIGSATGGIMVHVTVAAEIQGINEDLDLVMTQARKIAPEAATSNLAALSGRYTMHSERAIHASLADAAAAALTGSATLNMDAPATAAAGEEESELGYNVELF